LSTGLCFRWNSNDNKCISTVYTFVSNAVICTQYDGFCKFKTVKNFVSDLIQTFIIIYLYGYMTKLITNRYIILYIYIITCYYMYTGWFFKHAH